MKKYLPWILAGAFFVVGCITLSDYGMNWDEPFHLMRGQTYLQYYLTGRGTFPKNMPKAVLISPDEYASRYYYSAWEEGLQSKQITKGVLPGIPPAATFSGQSLYANNQWTSFFMSGADRGHPPLGDVGAAVFNRVFYQKLGILGDIESYHLFFLLISSWGVFVVTRLAYELTGSYVSAIVAGLSIGLFPIFWSESRFNSKDTMQAALYAGSIWALWHWVRENKSRWFWILILQLGVALGIKWNVIFLPVILVPWLVVVRRTDEFVRWFRVNNLLWRIVAGVAFICILFLLLWPAGISGGLSQIIRTVQYYASYATGGALLQPDGFVGPFGVNLYPAVLVFTQTPVAILALAFIGIASVIRKKSAIPLRGDVLILLWFIVTLVRISLPLSNFYGGLRQIMEVVPALALLSGFGVYTLMRITKGLLQKSIISIISICFIILLITLIRIHPNENIYFNLLTGGTRGASQHNSIDWAVSYGNLYRQASIWLARHAEPNARVAHITGEQFAISPLWLRPDMQISAGYFSGWEQKGEYILLLRNPLRPPVFAARFAQRYLRPVHEIDVDGVPMLTIYKNDRSLLLRPVEIVSTKDFSVTPVKRGDFTNVDIDPGASRDIAGMIIVDPAGRCAGTYSFIGDELVAFITESGRDVPLRDQFIFNERARVGNIVTFSFPGESARTIRITPVNQFSCFAEGTIQSIQYVKE